MARSVCFYTDSRILGGAERAMLLLASSLAPDAWRVTQVVEDADGTEEIAAAAEALGLPVERVAPMPLGLSGARLVPSFARFLRRHRFEVFHAHMSSPIAAKFGLASALVARTPAVIGSVQVVGDLELDRSSRIQLGLIARRVDRYIAVSRGIAEDLAGLGWPAAKIEVVYNAVDLGRFEQVAGAELQRNGRPVVLTVARHHGQKGLPTLLEAAAAVPGADFVLAGDGPDRGSLESRAAALDLGERVRFLGARSDVPELLAGCDVFALPSLYEGSSLAVLEAMAAGTAILSTDIEGTNELIESGRNGVLVPPGDPDAMARELARLAGDPSLRAALGAAAKADAESRFGRDQMAARVAGIYTEALAR